MKMRNKLSKIIGMGFLSTCILGGGLYFANQNNLLKEEVSPSYAYNKISNSAPKFFQTSNIEDTYSFVDFLSNEYASLSFAVSQKDNDEDGSLRGTYLNGTNYYAFDITNIDTSINGKLVTGIDYSNSIKSYFDATYTKTTDTDIVAGKTYYTFDAVENKYNVVTTPVKGNLADYFEAINKEYLYGLNFHPENIELNLSVDLDASKPQMGTYNKTLDTDVVEGKTYYTYDDASDVYTKVTTPEKAFIANYYEFEVNNNLILNEQGLVSITITYTQYDLSLDLNSETTVLNQNNVLTNQTITYNFFLLDRNTYLERGTTDSPAITYNDTITNRTSSGTPTYKYNYFYNFESEEIPTITYNPNHYEVTVVKVGENNSSKTNLIKYNSASQTFKVYNANGAEVTNTETSPVLDGENLTLYFNNTGEYVLKYSPIFISNGVYYDIDKQIESQRFYVFGYQAFYTVKSAQYEELKLYDENKTTYRTPADITARFKRTVNPLTIDNSDPAKLEESLNKILEELSPADAPSVLASTDQTPVKLQAMDGTGPTGNSKLYYFDGTTWEERDFSAVENYSLPGKYIIAVEYNFSSYTNKAGNTDKSKTFNQYFAFEITKSMSVVDVFTIEDGDEENLTGEAYTNDTVYIRFDAFDNKYNKPTKIELVRKDYNNNNSITKEFIDWYGSGTNYTLHENGTIKVVKDGNYTVNIYIQNRINPIERLFNIDTNANFNLKSYSVSQSSMSQNIYVSSEVEVLTNQSIIFSWDNVKKSGAKTYGYWKYYPMTTSSLYSESFLREYITAFTSKNVLPVEYELNLSKDSSWLQYDNFNYSINANKPVDSHYIKPNIGLHLFQTYDDAGNTQTKLFIIDKSTPVFLTYNPNTSQYQLLSQNNTLTEDATLIWGKYKIIKIPKNAADAFDIEDLDSHLFKNKNGDYDPFIYETFSNIICGEDLTETKANANISFLSLPNKHSRQSSYYLCVEINDDVYFKNYCDNDSQYKFISGKTHNYQYDIVSSYKLYRFKEDGKFYRSTTQGAGAYLTIEAPLSQYPEYNNDSSSIEELKTYIYNGSKHYLFAYQDNGVTKYRLFDYVNNVAGSIVSVTKNEDDLYYNGHLLTEVEFVDKEGQYVFLLRDQANTKGANLNAKNQYLSYPSAYQYLTITSDQSQLKLYFKQELYDEDGNLITKSIDLANSGYFNIGNKTINEGEDDEYTINTKSTYFSPTNEDVIYVSFKPTTISGDKKIQVKSVSITYYEFKTEVRNSIAGGSTDYPNAIVYNYYQSLNKVWDPAVVIYEYEKGIENTDVVEFELNITGGLTNTGYYEITRTYMTEQDDEMFLVTPYDYNERTLNAYVDRYNTITKSTKVSPSVLKDTISYKGTDKADINHQNIQFDFTVLSLPDETNTGTAYKAKYLYVPVEIIDDSNYRLISTSKTLEGETTTLDVTDRIKFKFNSGANATKTLSWAQIFGGLLNKKTYTDSDGQNYILVDFTSQVEIAGTQYYGFNSIAIESIMNGTDKIYDSIVPSSDKNQTSYIGTTNQSLVGGSIQVTMYSTYSKSTVLSIAHPGQTSDSIMMFNSGDSFYTKENTSNILDITPRPSTNKLPVSISIPKYKYTTYFEKTIQTSATNDDNRVVCNYVYETDILSYFSPDADNEDAKKESSITSYELEIEVEYYKKGLEITEITEPTKRYKSNGTTFQNTYKTGNQITSNDSGYLALYEYNLKTDVYSGLKNEFTEPGRYIVKITQAPYEVSSSAYNFKSTYAFAFTIEDNRPEYNIYSGTLLKSIGDTEYYGEDSKDLNNENNTFYYTNKDDILVSWIDSTSIYKANIDKNEIKINLIGSKKYNNYSLKLNLTPPAEGDTKGSVAVQVFENSSWKDLPELNELFSYSYSVSTLTNSLSFNLKDLGMNENGTQTTITMQLEGHNPDYYKTTVKTIVYDQTASNSSIAQLHSFLNNQNYSLSQSEIREYYLADGITKTDVSKASYNQTISSGVYSQYSFTVTRDYFEGLKTLVKNNIDGGFHNQTTAAFFNEIGENYIPTSNTYDFVASEYEQITDNLVINSDNVKTGHSYEIVERDLAGNLTIYIVYVTELDNTYYNEIISDDLANGVTFRLNNGAMPEAVKDSEITSGKYEISASTELAIDKVNHLGDEWNYFYTAIYNSSYGGYLNSYYLITPEIESGYAYKITGVATKTYTKFALKDLFESEEGTYKSYIYLLNKLTGHYNKVAISRADSAFLSYTTGEHGNDSTKVAYLSIALPSSILTNSQIIQAKPIDVKITDKSGDGANVIFGGNAAKAQNNPNDYVNVADYNYLNRWLAQSNAYVKVSYASNNLTFTIQNVIKDTKLAFEIIDNFGHIIEEIYLVGETKVNEVTSGGNLYSYYADIDGNVNKAYISSQEISTNFNNEKYVVAINLLSAKTSGVGLTEVIKDANGYINLTNLTLDNAPNIPFYVISSTKSSISSFTFGSKQNQYDIWLRVEYYDKENVPTPYNKDEAIKVYYIRLYNILPNCGDDVRTENDFYFAFTNSNGGDDTNELLYPARDVEKIVINGKTYNIYSSQQTFSDELKVAYSSSQTSDFPYEVLYYSTAEGWKNGNDFVPLASGSVLNMNGMFYILVKYTHPTVLSKEYYLFEIEILGSDGGYYYVLANGERKEEAPNYYTYLGTQYSDYYIVNINYGDRGIKEKFNIITNDYQNVKAFELNQIFETTGIYTYRYIVTNYVTATGNAPTNGTQAELEAHYAPTETGIAPFREYIFVTFLNPSNDLLSISTGTTSNLYYKTNDTADIYVTSATNQITMIIYDETANTDTMTLSWFKYYGIPSNLINVHLEKDGKKVSTTTYQNGNYYYINLTRSGIYSLKFEDVAGNIQSFYSGQKSLPLVFIKDVHFTMSYINPLTGVEEHTEAINKAVYNSEVKINLNKKLIEYYQSSTFGQGNIIKVFKDGVRYEEKTDEKNGYIFSSKDYSFTFKEPGYYTVSMDAIGKKDGKKIRSQTYSFSIINAKESRYAFEFSGYKNYYIERIIKDGIDITDALYTLLKTDSNYTTQNVIINDKVVAKNYLKNVLISYFDEKTGSGRYQVTINSNDELHLDETTGKSSFTFEFYINSQTVPISVSVEDGTSTTDDVKVTFNAKNVYDAVGECYIVVGHDTYYVNESTTKTVNLILGDNESDNEVYYIQVFSMSGNLLFSHKVNLTEPMNAWTIIAIIAGAIAVILILFIIIKLRKRIGVK